MMSNPNKYNLQITDDGSFTLYSAEYNEAMHTAAGAITESLIKHVYPSKVLQLTTDKVNVLDIGFGLGYNVLSLISEAKKISFKPFINIVSLEFDKSYKNFLESIFSKNNISVDLDIASALIDAFNGNTIKTQTYELKIIFADARKSICKLEDNFFDAVFQDPYSPSKNPELWSVEYFSELKRIMKKNSILTTYSAAPQIRSAMITAGFFIASSQSTGKKKEGTIASPMELYNSILPEEVFKNPKSVSYKDPNFKRTRDEILQTRLDEIKLNTIVV